MPTANEKKALWFLALIALSGSAVRLVRAGSPDLSVVDSAGITAQMQRVDSVRAFRHKKAPRESKSREPVVRASPEHPLDLDSASAVQIEALPGVGAAMARRIVTHRDSAGGLGSIDALCEVPGMRASLVERLRPLVTFTSARRPLSVECGEASSRTRKSRDTHTRHTR